MYLKLKNVIKYYLLASSFPCATGSWVSFTYIFNAKLSLTTGKLCFRVLLGFIWVKTSAKTNLWLYADACICICSSILVFVCNLSYMVFVCNLSYTFVFVYQEHFSNFCLYLVPTCTYSTAIRKKTVYM